MAKVCPNGKGRRNLGQSCHEIHGDGVKRNVRYDDRLYISGGFSVVFTVGIIGCVMANVFMDVLDLLPELQVR